MTAKSTSFTVSKRSAARTDAGVFREVSSNGHVTRVLNANTYERASERANKSIAASALAQKESARSSVGLSHKKPK